MTQNELQLNTEKTEAMLIGTRQKLSSISVNTLQLDNNTVPLSDSVKSLDVLLDSTLCMENFISQTAKSCYYSTVELVLSGSIFPPRLPGNWSPHSFCHAFLQFSPFWPVCFLCLRRIQNCAARLILKKQKQQNVKLTTSHLCFSFSTSFQSNKEFSTR